MDEKLRGRSDIGSAPGLFSLDLVERTGVEPVLATSLSTCACPLADRPKLAPAKSVDLLLEGTTEHRSVSRSSRLPGPERGGWKLAGSLPPVTLE